MVKRLFRFRLVARHNQLLAFRSNGQPVETSQLKHLACKELKQPSFPKNAYPPLLFAAMAFSLSVYRERQNLVAAFHQEKLLIADLGTPQ
jgi:hypothetical protein